MTSLATFFAEMEPFLLGQRSASDVLDRLGPSPSGADRFALYAELVQRQRRGILDHFYRPVAAAAEARERGRFGRLRDAYLCAHPPRHWTPNEAARAFPGFLSQQADVGEDLVSLADYAWARFSVMHAPHRPEDVGLDEAVLVRHYEWDVATFSEAVERRLAGVTLRAIPRTLLLGRHRSASTLVVLTPSLGALLALAAASGRVPALPDGLSSAMVVEEARALVERGLFPEGTATRVREALR
ncbi:MAG TPA: hypothetical protein VLT33_08825 [Labilithrix sp.]|nr:hypothetical protein [Labilithrix sp.]